MSIAPHARPFYASMAQQLVESGLVHVNENGDASLTLKGKEVVRKRLEKLPPGEELLLHIAMAETYNIPVSLY